MISYKLLNLSLYLYNSFVNWVYNNSFLNCVPMGIRQLSRIAFDTEEVFYKHLLLLLLLPSLALAVILEHPSQNSNYSTACFLSFVSPVPISVPGNENRSTYSFSKGISGAVIDS